MPPPLPRKLCIVDELLAPRQTPQAMYTNWGISIADTINVTILDIVLEYWNREKTSGILV